MRQDENITKALEALQVAYRFDAFFGKVPHPSDLKFGTEAENWFMHRIGSQLVNIAEGDDRQWVGRTVLRYFWKELGHCERFGEAEGIPRFLLGPRIGWSVGSTPPIWLYKWLIWSCRSKKRCAQ